jgi:hypothetical protein
MPSRLMRRSSFRTERNGASGSGRNEARSSAKASLTIRLVVAWTLEFATVSSQ